MRNGEHTRLTWRPRLGLGAVAGRLRRLVSRAGEPGPLRRRLRVAVAAAMTATLLGLAAVLIVPTLLGYDRYVITGESMSGTFERGSVVFTKAVAVEELRVGDIITYDPPNTATGTVTHRISWRGRDSDGERAFRTKGDANPVRDPWVFNLESETQAMVQFSVPYVGFALAAVALPWVRLLALALPAALIAILTLASMWRAAGEELRRAESQVLPTPTAEESVA